MWGKTKKKIWLAAPFAYFGLYGEKGNRVAFENGVTFAQRTKPIFLSNLWSWENLYSVWITRILFWIFLLGWAVGEFASCMLGW